MPGLKQVYLDHLIIREIPGLVPSLTPPDYNHKDVFAGLDVLVIGSHFQAFGGALPALPSTIRVIDILTENKAAVMNILQHDPDGPPPEFTHLEFFRCRADISPSWIYSAISPSLGTDGRLASLDISGNSSVENDVDAATVFANMPFPGRFHSLGMSNFRWPDSLSYLSAYTGRRFVEWVDRFPAVQTVAAYPQNFDTAGEVILSLVERGRVKTIYESCLSGVTRDKVLGLAKEQGVTIVHTRNPYRPAVFPWPERKEE